MGFGSGGGGFSGGKGDLDGDFKVRGTTPQITIGDAGAEDTFLVFDGNAVDYRIGIDDGTDILEIGAGSAHGTTTAIKINSSGHITQLGHQTSPTNGHFLKFDGSKIIFDSVSSGGGADVGIANTFTEAQSIAKDQDSELVALILKNASDANDTSGLVSLRFDLEDTGGNAVDSAKIAVKKEAAFTATASTQDSSMVFSTSLNGTLTERMTLDSAGALALGDDTDQSAKIGRVHLGYDATNSDMAIFSHRDNANQTDFALRQRASGQTEINAKASQTIDFKINSANQAQFEADGDFNLLIDGAKIQFGANSEVTLAHVHDEGLLLTHTATGDNKPVTLTLKSEEDVIIADEVLGAINFKGGDSDGTDAILVAAGIEAVATDTHAADNNATKLAFKTAASEAATEKMTLTSAGNLGVGVTDPDSKLEVLSTSTQAKFSYDADSSATVTVADASHTTIATGESGNLILDAAGDIEINADGGNITFKDGSDVIFDIVKNSGYHTIDITGDIRLDASDGDIAFLDNGALALIFDLDHTSGESHIYSMIDEQDVVFRAAHTSGTGVEILRLTDGGQAEIKDNLSLKSDAAVLKFGASEEVNLTHVADSGLQLTHTATGDNTPVVLTLKSSEADIVGETIGEINFVSGDTTGGDANLVSAGISAIASSTHTATNNSTKLSFKTAVSEAASEKMSLSPTGNLSITQDNAAITMGTNFEVFLTHKHNEGLQISHQGSGDNLPVKLTLKSEEDALIADEVIGALDFKGGDSDGTDTVLVCAGIEAVATDTHADDNNSAKLSFKTAASETATEKMALSAAGDLSVVTDGAAVKFGADAEVTLTHVHDTGLLLSDASGVGTTKLMFGDSATFIQQQADGQLGIDADSIINVTAPTVDIDASTTVTVDTATVDINASGLVTIDSVGLSIDSAGVAANITSTTDGNAEDFTIALAGATDSSLILSSTGTGGDALQIATSAGGMDITVAGAAAGEDLDISSNSSINVTATENAANTIVLHANGGTSETIKIHSDQGTSVTEGAASVQLLSDAGGIGIKSTANLANAVLITADGGTDETIVIHSDQGTGEGNANASIELLSDAGGICFTATGLTGVMTDGNSDAAIQAHAAAGGIGLRSTANLAGSIQIEADGGADETIVIHSDQGTGEDSITLTSDAGGIDINAAAGKDVTVDGGQLLLTSAHDVANAIYLRANAGTSETIKIHADQGSGEGSIELTSDAGGVDINAAASKDVTIDGGQLLLTSAHDVANSIYLRANAGTSETIKIHADQGTGAGSIELTSDAGSIDINSGDNVTIDAADEITVTTTSADGHISLVSAHTAGVALHIDANADAGSIVDVDAGILDIDVTGASTLDTTSLTVTTDAATFTSANANDPLIVIKNTTNDADGARLRFVKDKGAAGAANDVAGLIEFYADDANQDNILFAKMEAAVAVHTNGQEGGKLSLGVATHDGEFQNGLILTDGSAEDEIDVTVGNGADSVTTIAGDLVVTGNDITFGRSGETLQRVAQVRINSTTCDSTGNKDLFTLPADIILTAAYIHTKTALGDDNNAGGATISIVTSGGSVDFLQALGGGAAAISGSPFNGAFLNNLLAAPSFLDSSEALRVTVGGEAVTSGDAIISVLYILRD